MKQLYKKIWSTCAFFTASFLFSQYSDGIIISNEGGFGKSNAEISYVDANNQVTNGIYALANGGEILGDILQSIFFYEDKVILVVNNSDKVVIADRSSFKKIKEISVKQPRYATVAQGKMYITSSTEAKVFVMDAETFQPITTIDLDTQAEEIHHFGDYVYAVKARWGSGNQIDVINPNTNSIEKTISLEEGIRSVRTNGTAIYALSSSNSGTTLQEINIQNQEITKTISNSQMKGIHKMAIHGNDIFIAGNSSVYKISAQLSEMDNTPLFVVPATDSWFEFYGFDIVDGLLYEVDSNRFVAPSTVRTHRLSDGVVEHTLTTMIGANGIYKNVYHKLNTSETAFSSVVLYPNPATHWIYLKGITAVDYTLYNATGQLVKRGTYKNGISVEDLTSGIYFINLRNGEKTTQYRFIKK